jgi:hypothetical protein
MDMERRRLGLLRPPVIAGALLAANVLLAAGAAAAALRPRPVRIVPSARAAEDLLPGAVPGAAAREFALRYVVHFDNYTPSTLDATESVLQRMVAPRSWTRAAQTLERRRKLVQEGRMSSQVVPLASEADGLRVVVRAVRRVFIADRLSREAPVRYVVALEPQAPTDLNPYGLAVVSQEIEEESK